VAESFHCAADSAEIDDGTAEVFAALISHDCAPLRAFAGRSSLVTYLAVIATRSATRYYSRQRRRWRNTTPIDPRIYDPPSEETDSLAARIAVERQQLLLSLLDQFPNKQRSVVRMFHIEGKSYSEISQTLGMPIGSVGVTLRRVEAKLREELERIEEGSMGSSFGHLSDPKNPPPLE
jgi:RNA polymerase sigma-70 factor (ECF subfamily)